MKNIVLQVPMSKSLRDKAEKASKDMGFSSLQEVTRILLKKLSEKKLTVNVYDTDEIQLSPKAIKKYDKMYDDMKAGKNVFEAKSVEDFLAQLKA